MEDKRFVFILTSSFDRPEVAAGAMQLASNMKAFDIELDFFLMDKAVLFAKKAMPRRSGKTRTSSHPHMS